MAGTTQAGLRCDETSLRGAGWRELHLLDGFDRAGGSDIEGDPQLVSLGTTRIRGVALRTLFVHPPAAVSFRVPGAARRIHARCAIASEAWEKDTGPCEFSVLVDGEVLLQRVIDVRSRVEDRCWHDLDVELLAGDPTGSRQVTLRTRGIGGETFRWALFGEPVVEIQGVGLEHPQDAEHDAAAARERLEALATHPDNLSFNLYRELMYWNNQLAGGANPYIADRLDPATLGRAACPDFMVALVEEETLRLGRRPRVLDFGAGPFSTLVYLHHAGLAEVVAADALSDEYARLLASHGIEWPLIPERATGETLTDRYRPESFDIVFVSNALDHTQVPALVWTNLFLVTRVGGVLAHCHAIREATHENWDQLHQFDLFPVHSSLWIADAERHEFSLTDHLPLEASFASEFELPGFDWFAAAYRKSEAGEPGTPLLRHTLAQICRAHQRRSGWASTLEHWLGHAVDLSERFHGLPYYVSDQRGRGR